MENLKEKLIDGFKKEITNAADYSAIKQLRNTLSTTNFKLICTDVTKDVYVLVYKSLLSRVDYKDVIEILKDIDNKFEQFKKEIILPKTNKKSFSQQKWERL